MREPYPGGASDGLTWAVPCHPLMGLTRAAWVRMIRSHFAGLARLNIFKISDECWPAW